MAQVENAIKHGLEPQPQGGQIGEEVSELHHPDAGLQAGALRLFGGVPGVLCGLACSVARFLYRFPDALFSFADCPAHLFGVHACGHRDLHGRTAVRAVLPTVLCAADDVLPHGAGGGAG